MNLDEGMERVLNKKQKLFETDALVLMQTEDEIKYQIECDTVVGTMHNYHLYPGIDLSYTTFRADRCPKRENAFPNIIEIAYCSAGRYECEYSQGSQNYLGEGDIAISVMDSQRREAVFPTGFYDGVAIIIDTEIVGSVFSGGIEGIHIDFEVLLQKYCKAQCCTVFKASPELRRLFQELYRENEKVRLGYIRLKVLEVFFHLVYTTPAKKLENSTYYSSEISKKIKAIKDELMNDYSSRIPLKELADRYGISLTMLKCSFKEIYGKPVYAFQKEYRMQVAAKQLLTTELSITQISENSGYENPNKFSSAFKSVMGCCPREYRYKNN